MFSTGIHTNWFPTKSVPTVDCPLYFSLSAAASEITRPLAFVPPTYTNPAGIGTPSTVLPEPPVVSPTASFIQSDTSFNCFSSFVCA